MTPPNSNLPERVFLQIGPEWKPDDGTKGVSWGDVTHHRERIFDNDPEYIRADLHEAALKEKDAEIERIRAIVYGPGSRQERIYDLKQLFNPNRP